MVKFNTYRDNLLRRSGAGSMWYLDVASRRTAVGFAGCAPRFVPNRGHPALIPDAYGCALRLPDTGRVGGVGRSCCAPSPYHGVLAVQGLRADGACVLAAVCDP